MSVLGAAAIGAGISGILGLGSSAVSNKQQYKNQSKLQEEQYGYNSKLQQEQAALNEQAAVSDYERTLDYWNKQNEYNLPSNEVQRLKDAGLSIGLMYGGVGSSEAASGTANTQAGTSGTSVGLPGYNPQNYDFDFISRCLDLQEKRAAIQNVNANTSLQESQSGAVSHQVANLDSQTALNGALAHRTGLQADLDEINKSIQELNYDALSKMPVKQLQSLQSQIELQMMETLNLSWQAKQNELGAKFSADTFDWRVAIQECGLQSAMIGLLKQQVEIQAIRSGISLTEGQIAKIEQELTYNPALWESQIGLQSAQSGLFTSESDLKKFELGFRTSTREYDVLKNKYEAKMSRRKYRAMPFQVGATMFRDVSVGLGALMNSIPEAASSLITLKGLR